ncbi:thioesterase [Pseudomonas fluorescens]|uniref:PaaI family thioesterase n=1 Tax=Pseudomonas fluorescens TaxID=294 RepID=UPI00083D68CC|nr:PaaI family thioesterase [Pseudomonas fluorescens]AOE68015.1 thioesterase [Pseudomonas fluorescens]AOE74168.1 thioesterase [Pseudomonas fluorescens]
MNLVDEVAPGLSGLETLQALISAGGRPPIGESLDFTFVEAGDGWAVFTGTPGLHAYNPIGTIHGGYAATLLDSACGCAVHSKLSATQAYTTLELKVSYLRPITTETGPLRAEGRVISVGRRAAFAEATLKGADERIYASATSTLLVMERAQSTERTPSSRRN